MINTFLQKYLSNLELKELLSKLENKQRANILSENYFLKIGKNIDELFYSNLLKEIKLYELNYGNINFPNLIDYYVDDDFCVLVLEKISGSTIGNTRNNFNVALSDDKRIQIIEQIIKIKDIETNMELLKNYDRKEKLVKYLDKSQKYLDKGTIDTINNRFKEISKTNCDYVISHGDLISPNIMISNDKIIFIDWEFISYKPATYDIAYFMLFNKENDCFSYINQLTIDKKELIKDGIIICLKEIQNWAKLFGKVDEKLINSKINRWTLELKFLLIYEI